METISGNVMPNWAEVLVILFGAASTLVAIYALVSMIRSARVVTKLKRQVEELDRQKMPASESDRNVLIEKLTKLQEQNNRESEKVSIVLRWIAASGGLIGMSFLIKYGYKAIEGLKWPWSSIWTFQRKRLPLKL